MCYMYYFKHDNKSFCVDATFESGRLGRLINHTRKEANLTTKICVVDHVPRLGFVAKQDIAKGDELCYDYGDRRPEVLKVHPWLKQ